jgi:polysaccharide export outer membrane protein
MKKKLLTQALVGTIGLALVAGTFAQSPSTATRQRRAAPDTTVDQKTADEASPAAPSDKPAESSNPKPDAKDKPAQPSEAKPEVKNDQKPAPDVTADAQTNRTDESSEEAAIVPYYNNFFKTYRLGPEDVISVTVFGQDRYSKQGIVIPPSGRISLALIPDGIFVNGKTVDQVAELIKQRYDEYIIDPQVSVSLDRAGSYRYSVIGDVAQPGIRLMTRRLSATEAIAEAGGILQTGDKKKVFVLRKQQNGNLVPIPINIAAIYRGQAPDSVYLVPGDQLVVPGNRLKKWQTLSSFLPVLSFARLFTGGW